MKSILQSAFVRQIIGAAIGATVAFAIYTAGTWTMDKVQAYLGYSASSTDITEETQEARMDRVGGLAKEKAEQY